MAGALALGRRKCQEEEADIKEEEKDWMYGLKTKNLSEKEKVYWMYIRSGELAHLGQMPRPAHHCQHSTTHSTAV